MNIQGINMLIMFFILYIYNVVAILNTISKIAVQFAEYNKSNKSRCFCLHKIIRPHFNYDPLTALERI